MRRENRKLFKNNLSNKETKTNKFSKQKKDQNYNTYQKINNKNSLQKINNNQQKINKKDFPIKENLNITTTFTVNHSTELLDFLLVKCKTSRNNVKNLLASKKVLVNGSVVSQYNFNLAKDDEIKISKHSVQSIEKKPSKKQVNQKTILPFNIIYEDEDFIAIDKPCGLLSVESDNDRVCAFGYLLNYLQQKNKFTRPYILHRIDKETSGVLVFTTNIKLHSMLKLNWNDLVKTREYIAVVEGSLDNTSGTLTNYLTENKNNLMFITHNSSGQKAITHYKVLNSNEYYSLLKINIDTGRKNQIRVQMNNIGHSVIGDDKYGCNYNPLNRLGLHASKLEFYHPITKQLISISCKTPQSFINLFK